MLSDLKSCALRSCAEDRRLICNKLVYCHIFIITYICALIIALHHFLPRLVQMSRNKIGWLHEEVHLLDSPVPREQHVAVTFAYQLFVLVHIKFISRVQRITIFDRNHLQNRSFWSRVIDVLNAVFVVLYKVIVYEEALVTPSSKVGGCIRDLKRVYNPYKSFHMESVILTFHIVQNLELKFLCVFDEVFANLLPMVNEAHLMNLFLWFMVNLILLLKRFGVVIVIVES